MRKISRRAALMLPATVAFPAIVRGTAAIDDADIAQLLIFGFLGASVNARGVQDLARHCEAGRLGGICFLGHNTRKREHIEALTAFFRQAAGQQKPFICVDQEGGAVQRLGKRSGYRPYPTARKVASAKSVVEAEALYAEMAAQLIQAGFNVNLAPVVDLGFEPRNPVVSRWGRAFGADGPTVAKYAQAFIAGHRRAGMLTALKHFPGHGSTLVDSHQHAVDLTPTWRPEELLPFRRLSEQGMVDIVMSGHLRHRELSGDLPATLSPQIVRLLRDDIGYQGVIMTDDLDMQAIRRSYSLMDAIVQAIGAGNDMILISNTLKPDPDLPKHVIRRVKEAVADGRIAARTIAAAAARIAKLKASFANDAV